jgi:hypothetical protein
MQASLELPAVREMVNIANDVLGYDLFSSNASAIIGIGHNNSLDIIFIRLSESRTARYDIEDLIINGPAERLDDTEFAQPAILLASLAALEVLKVRMRL